MNHVLKFFLLGDAPVCTPEGAGPRTAAPSGSIEPPKTAGMALSDFTMQLEDYTPTVSCQQ